MGWVPPEWMGAVLGGQLKHCDNFLSNLKAKFSQLFRAASLGIGVTCSRCEYLAAPFV